MSTIETLRAGLIAEVDTAVERYQRWAQQDLVDLARDLRGEEYRTDLAAVLLALALRDREATA